MKSEELDGNESTSADLENGLKLEEVRRSLGRYGFNEITEKKPNRAFSFLRKF